MIKLTDKPKLKYDTVEALKITENFYCYGDIALFWEQDDCNLQISMLDGNMIIDGESSDLTELFGFLKMISPSSIFAKTETLENLGFSKNRSDVFLMKTVSQFSEGTVSDALSSKQVFDILNGGGLEMPSYDNFAVDFCHRKNMGRLDYFAIQNKACAVAIGKEVILLNGIKSLEKGLGSKVLRGLLSKHYGKTVFAVCNDKNLNFYLKNGFIEEYKVSYWRK